jgi:hypothetical protein
MFEASTVVKTSGAPSRRPATKKSLVPRTMRATINPIAISAAE